MTGETRRRRELGAFLRARRQQLTRADLGLPAVGRRTTGLRREEIAYLSRVSITWYTWLEQGRKITPSRQVLDAIACTLHLSGPEHAYILALAGYAALQTAPESITPAIPAHVRRLLDALGDLPAYVLAPDWTILGWTSAFVAAYPNVGIVPDEDRNLLWLVFTDPYLRDLQNDWHFHSAHHLAEFRAEAGPRLGEPPFARLVERLLEASEHFRATWENHDIDGFTSRERIYHHPRVGDLHLELHRMTLSDQPGLHLIIYTPMPNTDTAARLRQLLDD
ncbi:helix-turn-helix transcriptional regulator [Pseudonocardia xinjiangensis]|uniref:helix-turn-helix transcriptional regulator n=1 Tax=Pseudonocardia xinjiangensis TaxID=75289 RepID=UPI003D93D598